MPRTRPTWSMKQPPPDYGLQGGRKGGGKERERANGEYDSGLQECCVSILKIIMQVGAAYDRLITKPEPSLTSVNANYFQLCRLCSQRSLINRVRTNCIFFVPAACQLRAPSDCYG